MSDQLENFERAFRAGTAGCVRTCNCGKVYYHNEEAGYGWEHGEFRRLTMNEDSKALDYCPSDIWFEGVEYVDACDCWHGRARAIIGWMSKHDRQIAEFLSLEKKRKQAIADESPVVDSGGGLISERSFKTDSPKPGAPGCCRRHTEEMRTLSKFTCAQCGTAWELL